MICTPGFIWDKWSKAAYKSRATEEGATFRESNRESVIFSECVVTVAAASLKGHMKRHHVRSVPQTREVEMGGVGGCWYQLPM